MQGPAWSRAVSAPFGVKQPSSSLAPNSNTVGQERPTTPSRVLALSSRSISIAATPWQREQRSSSISRPLEVTRAVALPTKPTERLVISSEPQTSAGELLPNVQPALPQSGPIPSTSGRQAVDVDQDTVWHFAYGANMNFYTLQRRGVKVVSRDAATLVDPSVKMVFKHRGGYATLAHLPEDELPKYQPYNKGGVHGVLYKVSKEDFQKLEKHEGGYTQQEVEVRTYSGRVQRAMCFVSSPMARLPLEVVPTEKYMALLREGAADNYLEPMYQAWLSSINTVPSTGLPADYYNTPSKYVSYGFLLLCAIVGAGFFLQ